MYIYILIGLLVFVINTIPALMPPTWIILAYFFLSYKLSLAPLVFIGAFCAVSGRVTLYFLAKNHFRLILPKKMDENLLTLGKFFNKRAHITIPLFITYAFFPIPSNHVYIAAGLARANVKILAVSFFVGRIISYTFWVSSSQIITTSIQSLFSNYYQRAHFSIEIIGCLLLIVVMRINWKKLLSQLE